MGELDQEYGDRVDFVIVSADDTQQRQDEIIEYGFVDLKHGLVAFTVDGEAAVKIPGHQFGREEIEAAVLEVLPES